MKSGVQDDVARVEGCSINHRTTSLPVLLGLGVPGGYYMKWVDDQQQC